MEHVPITLERVHRQTFGTFGEGKRFKSKLAVDLTNRLSITFKVEWPVRSSHSRWRIPNGLDRRH